MCVRRHSGRTGGGVSLFADPEKASGAVQGNVTVRIEYLVRLLDGAEEAFTPLRRAASPVGMAAAAATALAIGLLWPGFNLAGLVIAVLLPIAATGAYHLAEAAAGWLATLRPRTVLGRRKVPASE